MYFDMEFLQKKIWRICKAIFTITIIIAIGVFQKENTLLGISSRMDSYSQDLFNTGVQYLPPFLSELVYPLKGQDSVSVLLLTDETVDGSFSGKWPISYSAHGRILNNLLRYRPKAVVIDFLWLNPDKPGVAFLVNVLNRYKQNNIPVYLTFRKLFELQSFWPELQGLVIPVSPRIAEDQTDFIARNYKVELKEFSCPAVRVFRDLYDSDFAVNDTSNMQIFWGVNENTKNTLWMDQDERQDSALGFLVNGFSTTENAAPYTTTVLVRDLLNPTDKTEESAHTDLQNHLSSKVVFYGAHITGSSDIVYTPTRQLRPGVYYHSMALDNLISYNGCYKSEKIKDKFKNKWGINDIYLHIIILLIPSIIIYSRHHSKKQVPCLANANRVSKWSLALQSKWVLKCSAFSKGRIPPIATKAGRLLRDWIIYRLPLYGWVFFCVTICFFYLELAPRHWAGYILFAELSFYIDNILRFENTNFLTEDK